MSCPKYIEFIQQQIQRVPSSYGPKFHAVFFYNFWQNQMCPPPGTPLPLETIYKFVPPSPTQKKKQQAKVMVIWNPAPKVKKNSGFLDQFSNCGLQNLNINLYSCAMIPRIIL